MKPELIPRPYVALVVAIEDAYDAGQLFPSGTPD
jgi:hypothetical protein